MINLDVLWIGDELKVKSTGLIGTFEGIHSSGMAIIRSQSIIHIIAKQDLEMYVAPKQKENLVLNDIDQSEKVGVADSIDLHIEVLSPDLKESRPERILDVQVKAFEDFLAAAKKVRKYEVTIIHGKGSGVLKNCVMTLLKSDKEISQYYEMHNGGAVKVVLSPF